MGLFRKKNDNADQMVAMQQQLAAMAERLERADGENRRLAEDLAAVDGRVADVDGRVAAVDGKVAAVDGRVAAVDGKVAEVDGKVYAVDGRVAAVDGKVAAVDRSSGTFGQQLDELAASSDEHRARLADLALVATEAARRSAADDELRRQVAQIAEKVAALDGRVGQISVELTNQLTEVGGELDRLHALAEKNDLGAIDERLDDVTSGQERLASGQERLAAEQARYEIRFREDLAEIADRLRRPGSG